MIRRPILPLLAFILAVAHANAAVGDPPAVLLEGIAEHEPRALESGFVAADDFGFEFELRSGVVYALHGEGFLNARNIAFMADLVAAGTGYGESIASPVAGFLSTRIAEIAGRDAAAIRVESYRLTLEVTGEGEPYFVEFSLALEQVPEERFPTASHVIGPRDARFVVREFSDFQCPFCAGFAARVLPALEESLLERGDVRFEFHHFPLKSIHPNATAAAEAADCVTEANSPEDFWTYHDALFDRQGEWQGQSEPRSYFVSLAEDLDLASEGVATCLEEGHFRESVNAAYSHAGGVLGLSGTPSVFINGYRVQDYQDPRAYQKLLELIDAFAGEE